MKRIILLLLLSVLIIKLTSCKKKEELQPEKPSKSEMYGSLEGSIKNQYGQPIEGALITVGSLTTLSAVDGSYSFIKVVAKQQTITVSKDSYLPDTQNLTIIENTNNKLDFALSTGKAYLMISDSILNVSNTSGLFNLKIYSNAGWTVKNSSSWLVCSKQMGEGNSTIDLSYPAYTNGTNRTDTIQLICGTIKRNVVVFQFGQFKITSFAGIIGNNKLNIKDSVYLKFNKPVKSITIKSNYINCLSEINYNRVDNNYGVMFSYSCAALGGLYQFTIAATDENGMSISQDINVPFYKSKLDIAGFMTDYLLINNEKEVLIATFNPSKIIRYSIEKDAIIQTYDLSQLISPIKLSYNPYNSKVYIMGSDPSVQLRSTTVDKPYIYTLNVENGQILKEMNFSTTRNVGGSIEFNIPYNIGFTKSGLGMILFKSLQSSGLKWQMIDCTNNNAITDYPFSITNANYFDNIQLNYDQSKIILTQTYIGSCYYGIFDSNTQRISFLPISSCTRSVFITPSRKNENIYIGQLYDQFITDLNGKTSKTSSLDNRSNGSADFSYRANEEKLIYFCSDDDFKLLDYNNSNTLMTCDVIYGFRKFNSTTDGKLGIAYKQNSDLSSSLFVFDINSLYRYVK